MKKVIKICGIIGLIPVAFILVFVILFTVASLFAIVSDWDKYGVKTTLWGSDYKIEHTNSGFGDYDSYIEYHFNDKTIEKFKNNKWYEQVTDEDVENIKGYFERFERIKTQGGYDDVYTFDKDSQINAGDYFRIYTLEGKPIGTRQYSKYENYDVYYVDLETKTVYFIHWNI